MPPDSRTLSLPIVSITLPTDRNGRLNVDPEKIDTLARSIARIGLLHPITVRVALNRYAVIAGFHRLLACRQLGWTHIACISKDCDDLAASTIRLSENANRANLSPVEEALQLGPLVDAHPDGVDGVAADTGRSQSWILDRLDILSWPPSLHAAVHDGKVSLSAAKRLVRIPDPELRELRINDAAAHGINARTAALWLQDALSSGVPLSNVSENGSFSANSGIATETTILCYVCEKRHAIENTATIRLCTHCGSMLASLREELKNMPQPQTPTSA